jgi:hypothetical protein
MNRLARTLALSAATLLAAGGLAGSAAALPPRDVEPGETIDSRPLPAIPTFQDPDFAADIFVGPCPSPSELDAIAAAVAGSGSGASHDVRPLCDEGRLRLGVWVTPPDRDSVSVAHGRDVISPAREAGMARIALGEGLVGGLRVHPRFTRLLENAVEVEALRQFRGGSKRLDDVTVRVAAPDRVITTIKGHDTASFPDVSFTTTITDTMALAEGRFTCTSLSRTKADTRLFDALSVFGPGVGIKAVFGAQALLIRDRIADQNAKPQEAGPACRMLAEVFPVKFLVPDGLKQVLFYGDAGVVADGGLEAHFTLDQLKREPSARLEGPAVLTLRGSGQRGPVSPEFRLITDDLRFGQGSRITWTATVGRPSSPGSTSRSRVVIDTAGLAEGASMRTRIRVEMTDSDGLRRSAVKDLVVRRLRAPAPPPERGGPLKPAPGLD